jgi:hypothetical protein
MFHMAIGVGVVILFLRMARLDEENPALWGTLAAAAWFVPPYVIGSLASYVFTAVLFGAYFALKMMKPPKGGTVR